MIRKWIKKWLGITKLETDNIALRCANESLTERFALFREHVKKLQDQQEHAQFMEAKANASAVSARQAYERVEKLADIFLVGLDYSPSGYDKSWVVCCIRGKMERVQFMDVSNKEAIEIQKFLSMFNRENVTVDAGPMSHMFKK